jgi:hypothetical protein
VIKTPDGRKSQKWYFDQRILTIKTRYNNQSFDIVSSGKGVKMQIWSTNSEWFQVFKYENRPFINFNKNMVHNVWKVKDEEGQKVEVRNRSGKTNLL